MTRRKRGRRGLRVALASAIAALGVSAVGVSSASADTITLDHGWLKISGLPDPTEIIDPVDGSGSDTGPVQFNNVTYDGGGNFSVTTGNVDFPEFEGDLEGIPLSVQVTPLETITGNLNTTTGVLTTQVSDFRANIALGAPLNADCDIEPIPLDLRTANNSIFEGNVFDPLSSNPPTNGAITDDWASLPAPQSNSGDCSLIAGVTGGPGGLWLSNGIATPTLVEAENPPTPTPNKPKKKKCKKKKKKGKKGADVAKKKKCKKKKKKK